MKNLIIMLVTVLSCSATAFASSATLHPSPRSAKTCITVLGYEVLCVEITVEEFLGGPEELNLIGEIDSRTNKLNLSGFPKNFNTHSFVVNKDTNLRPADKGGENFILNSGKYQVKEGKSSILMTRE